MNILLDFIPFQINGGIGGAASYAKAVSDEICSSVGPQDQLFATYDSSLGTGRQYDHEDYARQHNITLVDLSAAPLSRHIAQNNIQVVFIAIAQFYSAYDLSGISCRVVMGIHDIWDVEREDNHIELIIRDSRLENTFRWLKRLAGSFSGRHYSQQQAIYNHIMPLYAAPATISFTVSEYTRAALTYHFPVLTNKDIHVLYSPARAVPTQPAVENEQLRSLIDNKRQYLFMLSANRRLKNARLLVEVYQRLLAEHPDLHLVTLKYGCSVHPQHMDIPFLTDADLQHAYKHAYALVFTSFFEGFGYPPVEAMRYQTPTVVSNVTSIPEIVGEAGIYFSPFYPADLFRALKTVLKDRNCRATQLSRRFAEVTKRQQDDLKKLSQLIISNE